MSKQWARLWITPISGSVIGGTARLGNLVRGKRLGVPSEPGGGEQGWRGG
jgi:hypothetical protein